MRAYSLKNRAEKYSILFSSCVYAIIISFSYLLIQNDRHSRHERHAMAVMASINTKDISSKDDLVNFVNDFSNKRLLVWIARGSQDEVIMPSGEASVELQSEELLTTVNYRSDDSYPASSFSLNGNRYFTCSMPGPDKSYSIRFLEDVGVDPLAQQTTLLGLFLAWLGISVLSILAIKIASSVLIKPVKNSAALISNISLDDLDDSKTMTQIAQDQAPLELQSFLSEYSSLLSRIQSDYENTKFIISGVGHEMRGGFSAVMNYLDSIQRNAYSPVDLSDIMRSCKSSISSSVNTLDNILRLARNDSGLASVNIADVAINDLISEIRERFEDPSDIFPVAVETSTIDHQFTQSTVSTDISILEWAVESLLLNAKKYAFTSKGAIVSVSVLNYSDLVISVSDFGPGIDNADQQKIFKRYSRGSNVRNVSGSGIGLAVLSELLNLIHANISLIDSPNQIGACFQITAPGTVSLKDGSKFS